MHHIGNADVPCFLINLDRSTDRLTTSMRRIHDAGFRNVTRFPAVDALDTKTLAETFAVHNISVGSDHSFNEHIGEQGCTLSHLNLWKHIIEKEIPKAIVFEDDLRFHSQWTDLANMYFEKTPDDFHILYLGSQIEHPTEHEILQVPVYCTHAYVISYEGAKVLYNYITTDPKGMRVIDCMLRDAMCDSPPPFKWYAWNGMMHPDLARGNNPNWVIRNTGLVYQDESFETLIKPRPIHQHPN